MQQYQGRGEDGEGGLQRYKDPMRRRLSSESERRRIASTGRIDITTLRHGAVQRLRFAKG